MTPAHSNAVPRSKYVSVQRVVLLLSSLVSQFVLLVGSFSCN